MFKTLPLLQDNKEFLITNSLHLTLEVSYLQGKNLPDIHEHHDTEGKIVPEP